MIVNNDLLQELNDKRSAVADLVERAKATLRDLDEQIALATNNDPDDFSGVVQRLRDKGVLPASKQ